MEDVHRVSDKQTSSTNFEEIRRNPNNVVHPWKGGSETNFNKRLDKRRGKGSEHLY